MSMLFRNELHEDFGSWPIAYIPYGGADFGEIRAVAEAVGDGDHGAFYEAWVSAGDRLKGEAEAALSAGHKVSARELYLRASVFYSASYHPLYGAPVDPRLLTAFRKQTDALEMGLGLSAPTIERLSIPLDETPMPGYFIPAQGLEHEMRPLIIFNNGYDCTITDTYFACAVAASRRGYHSLLFDGPGQGSMLYEHNIPLRPDWDVIIRAVVDFAVNYPLVDPDRIALSGWSLGGLLAPRGAADEPRIAALIADPGTWSIADGFRRVIIQKFGVPAEAVADLGALDQKLIDTMDAFIRSNPVLNWKVVQRGFWVHGVDSLSAFLASAELFTMRGHAERIQCPTLITQAENDGLAADAGFFFDTLRCPKTLIRFTAAEGADGHCEMKNRSLLNRRVLDWLDAQFGPGSS
ncbi:alpha/beta hydrolase family protein [Rhizobium sp. 768_B6_N1_8]|jgi:alpha-beta hydrolase superfamily lysophospholipase|uniref:alpha/beta hydrolase family protein n=1 Tax=unclassified Rhizobium TaxID=2613769 RepID=UPI003F1E66EA